MLVKKLQIASSIAWPLEHVGAVLESHSDSWLRIGHGFSATRSSASGSFVARILLPFSLAIARLLQEIFFSPTKSSFKVRVL